MSTSALVNVGTVLTGNMQAPRADADVLVMGDGKIQYLGDRSGWDLSDVEQVWDVQGMTVTPGPCRLAHPSGDRRLVASARHARLAEQHAARRGYEHAVDGRGAHRGGARGPRGREGAGHPRRQDL